jgi:hypothetical protein
MTEPAGGDHRNASAGPWRRAVRYLLVSLAVLVVGVALTLLVGFPGPGGLRRYPVADLNSLADRINRSAHSGPYASCSPPGDIATVDLVASRVVVGSTLPVALNENEKDMVVGKNGGPTFAPLRCEIEN